MSKGNGRARAEKSAPKARPISLAEVMTICGGSKYLTAKLLDNAAKMGNVLDRRRASHKMLLRAIAELPHEGSYDLRPAVEKYLRRHNDNDAARSLREIARKAAARTSSATA